MELLEATRPQMLQMTLVGGRESGNGCVSLGTGFAALLEAVLTCCCEAADPRPE